MIKLPCTYHVNARSQQTHAAWARLDYTLLSSSSLLPRTFSAQAHRASPPARVGLRLPLLLRPPAARLCCIAGDAFARAPGVQTSTDGGLHVKMRRAKTPARREHTASQSEPAAAHSPRGRRALASPPPPHSASPCRAPRRVRPRHLSPPWVADRRLASPDRLDAKYYRSPPCPDLAAWFRVRLYCCSGRKMIEPVRLQRVRNPCC